MPLPAAACTGNVRRYDHVLHLPQRVFRRQWLAIRHIESSAGIAAGARTGLAALVSGLLLLLAVAVCMGQGCMVAVSAEARAFPCRGRMPSTVSTFRFSMR